MSIGWLVLPIMQLIPGELGSDRGLGDVAAILPTSGSWPQPSRNEVISDRAQSATHPFENVRNGVGRVEDVAVHELDSRHGIVVDAGLADGANGADVPDNDADRQRRFVTQDFEEGKRCRSIPSHGRVGCTPIHG